MLPPLLLIDKPKGISSFSVIRQLRRQTGRKKFGHAGTLDPLATGLLLVGVGKGTKMLTGLVGLDKDYVATICIGERRTTGDLEGDVLEEKEYDGDGSLESVDMVLQSLIGTQYLTVPAYSAIKQQGVPLYKKARQTHRYEEMLSQLPTRPMVVYEARCISGKIKGTPSRRLYVTVHFSVSSGTYIRSLAEEVGRRLGYPATLAALRRVRVGPYRIEDAAPLSSIGNTMRTRIRRLLLRLCRLLGRPISS